MKLFFAFFTPTCFVVVVVAAFFHLIGFGAKISFIISFVWLLTVIFAALPVGAHLHRHNNSLPPVYRIVYKMK